MADVKNDPKPVSPATDSPPKEGPVTSNTAEGNPKPHGDGIAVASAEQNAVLKHSEGGTTTRDDANDLGVPMLQGSGSEPVGPEDALGEGPKRGDYSQRLGGSSYNPHDGSEPQKPRVADIGDAEGLKGGVETDPKYRRR